MLGSTRLSRTAFLITAWCTLVFSQAAHAEDLSLCAQGWAATERRDFGKALPLYDQCMQTGDLSAASLARTHRNIAITYRELGRPQMAIDHEDKALALRPIDAWNDHVNRGNAASDLGRFDEALADYDKAAALKPNLADVHYNRGIVYERLEQRDKAKDEFMKAYLKGLRSTRLQERLAVHGMTLSRPPANPPPAPAIEHLSPSLEAEAITAIARDVHIQYAGVVCARGPQEAEEAIKSAAKDWRARNDPDLQAAVTLIRAFGHQTMLAQGLEAEQAYFQRIREKTLSQALVELKKDTGHATPGNGLSPLVGECNALAQRVRLGKLDFVNTPQAVRELVAYRLRAQ